MEFNLEKIKSPSDFPPIVLLYGKDGFGLDEAYRNIRHFLAKDEAAAADLEVIDGAERDLAYVLLMAAQLPMLSSRRLLFVKRFDNLFKEKTRSKKDQAKAAADAEFTQYIDSPNQSTVLVLMVEEPEDGLAKSGFSPKKAPFDRLLARHPSIEFPRVYANRFPRWVADRFARRGVKVDQRTAELIVSNSPQKLMDISNEVDKLLLHDPAAKSLSFEQVSKLIGYTRHNTVYDLANAVAARNTNKAYAILLNILKTPGQELIIINTLRDTFIKIWKMIELKVAGNTDEAIAKSIGVHPFFLKDYTIALSKYSLQDVDHSFVFLASADKQMKSTNYNKKLVMQQMLSYLMNND